ncbi:MAG TPA: ATP-binding protein, partial [Candidatus Acidoferrales bacterium]|nr:ATP-binding protein [Candidatus Acidoferrales bacterium]
MPPDSAARRHIDEVMRAAVLSKGLIAQILSFSRTESSRRLPVSVRSVVEDVLALLGPSVGRHVHIEKVLDASDLAVIGDPTELHQAVMTLCTNALQAVGDRGTISVSLARIELVESRALSHDTVHAGAYAQIAVSDTGTGIAPSARSQIFKPFFTTKGKDKGTGLGLALVHTIVGGLGGTIDVTSEVGVGTTFTLWLPAARHAVAPSADESAELPPRGHAQQVAFVDDDPVLVELGEEMLAGLGYEPTGFHSGLAALEALHAEPRRFEVVLVDEVMPDLTGTALAREIRRLRPDI